MRFKLAWSSLIAFVLIILQWDAIAKTREGVDAPLSDGASLAVPQIDVTDVAPSDDKETFSSVLLNWIGAICQVVLVGAAVCGVVLTSRGLKVWREQLSGTTEYDVAVRYLQQLYAYDDTVRSLRLPSICKPAAGRFDPKLDAGQAVLREKMAYVSKQTQEYMDARVQLRVLEHEAQAVWGTDVFEDSRIALANHVTKLYDAIQQDLRNSELGIPSDPKVTEILENYDLSDGVERRTDEFGTDLRKCVANLAEEIASKIPSHKARIMK